MTVEERIVVWEALAPSESSRLCLSAPRAGSAPARFPCPPFSSLAPGRCLRQRGFEIEIDVLWASLTLSPFTSQSRLEHRCGTLHDVENGRRRETAANAPVAYAVRDFYLNGGGQAVVVRLIGTAAPTGATDKAAGIAVTANSPGRRSICRSFWRAYTRSAERTRFAASPHRSLPSAALRAGRSGTTLAVSPAAMKVREAFGGITGTSLIDVFLHPALVDHRLDRTTKARSILGACRQQRRRPPLRFPNRLAFSQSRMRGFLRLSTLAAGMPCRLGLRAETGNVPVRRIAEHPTIFAAELASPGVRVVATVSGRRLHAAVVALGCDTGRNYFSKFFDDKWLMENQLSFAEPPVHSVGDLIRKRGERKLVTVTPDTTIEQAIQLMEATGISQLPVIDGGRPVGSVQEVTLPACSTMARIRRRSPSAA